MLHTICKQRQNIDETEVLLKNGKFEKHCTLFENNNETQMKQKFCQKIGSLQNKAKTMLHIQGGTKGLDQFVRVQKHRTLFVRYFVIIKITHKTKEIVKVSIRYGGRGF